MLLKLIKNNKLEVLLLSLLLLVTVFLRFSGLGYSHFYGDETKTFYLDKTIPATKFFLDQRKGPIQFLVVWMTEKLIGGFDEFGTRLPFALAGTLSVFALYFLVRKLFGPKTAFIASTLFSINGFYVAFSRTVQYQSFLILFGLLSLVFLVSSFEETRLKKIFFLLSSIFLGLAFLCHYDALFFAVPVLFILSKFVVKSRFKEAFLLYVLPFIVIVLPFYLPYVIGGYLTSNTVN